MHGRFGCTRSGGDNCDHGEDPPHMVTGSFDGVPVRMARGTNGRNNTCNIAIACQDRTYLERSSWQGYRKYDSSERYYSAYTGVGCMSGTYDWKTAHKARYIVPVGASQGFTIGPISSSAGSNGVDWSQWFSHFSGAIRMTTTSC